MTKKLIISAISIFLLVLAIVTASLAWYINQNSVTTTETVLTAAESVNFTISVVPNSNYQPYMGQTGLNKGSDSVYAVDFVIGVGYNVQGFSGMGVKVRIDDSTIMKVDPENPTQSVLVNGDENAFTWRLYDYTVTEGQYVKLQGYKGNENGFIVADNEVENSYIITGSGTMSFIFTLLFQSEANYIKWRNDIFDYDAFPYSTPDYMDATFRFNVNFSTEFMAG